MHPSFQSVYQHQPFPPIVGVTLLSILLDKTTATISADRNRAPHKLPPACTPPESQKPLWIVEDVVAWLRNYQEAPVLPEAPKRKTGRPTKAEQVRKARAAQQSEVE